MTPTKKTQENKQAQKASIIREFSVWLKTLTPAQQRAGLAGLRHELTRRQAVALVKK